MCIRDRDRRGERGRIDTTRENLNLKKAQVKGKSNAVKRTEKKKKKRA